MHTVYAYQGVSTKYCAAEKQVSARKPQDTTGQPYSDAQWTNLLELVCKLVYDGSKDALHKCSAKWNLLTKVTTCLLFNAR